MPMQQVEFEFPDSDSKIKAAAEIEVPGEEIKSELSVEGPVGRENVVKPGKNKKADDFDVEIEIVDDTPVKDRGKKPAPPPEEVTDEELGSYSKKVQERLQHFTKGFHDERRAKEQAFREREALETYTKALLAENQQLKGSVDKGHNALVESAKAQIKNELIMARQGYKNAYESGDTDAIVAAQEQLNTVQLRMDKINGLKLRAPTSADTALQASDNRVQQPQAVPPTRAPVATDAKAEAWREENSWFGSDDEMTAYALGYHSTLVKSGVDPKSDDYYGQINARMRKMFPEQFNEADAGDEPETLKPRKAANVVAPATRSTAPRKVRLTESQVAIARKLGVSLEEYAKQVANLQRNS